ncbi:hypothetical protein [Metabacillus litoralis]|nr:hypothetical protein [Metabacillus litoralis]
MKQEKEELLEEFSTREKTSNDDFSSILSESEFLRKKLAGGML